MAYYEQREASFIHGNTNRIPANKTPFDSIVKTIDELDLRGCNFTELSRLLFEYKDIRISASTLRNQFYALGVLSSKCNRKTRRALKKQLKIQKNLQALPTSEGRSIKNYDTGKVKPHLSNFYVINRPIYDDEIMRIYRGLWKIEETFKVTKTTALNTRPIYLSKKGHIESHFLMCFVSLVILRVLQLRLDWEYSATTIAKSLAQATGNYFTDGYYVFAFQDKELEALEKDLGIPLAHTYIRKGDARTILGKSKNILPQ